MKIPPTKFDWHYQDLKLDGKRAWLFFAGKIFIVRQETYPTKLECRISIPEFPVVIQESVIDSLVEILIDIKTIQHVWNGEIK